MSHPCHVCKLFPRCPDDLFAECASSWAKDKTLVNHQPKSEKGLNMERKVELTFNGITALIESDSEGFFNLNDIWHSFKLPEAKRPKNWRDEMRRLLSQGAKLRSVNTGKVSKTLADEDALYAYAMWVSPEFGLVVIAAFRNLVHGDVDAAVEEASKVARDPIIQEIRDSFNPNRPNRHWKKRAKQRLLEDPLKGRDSILAAYKVASIDKQYKPEFFLQCRRLIDELIDETSDLALKNMLDHIGRTFEEWRSRVLMHQRAI